MTQSRKVDIIKSKLQTFTPEEVIKNNIPINNIIFKSDKPDLKWIEESTNSLADWRQRFLSTYARWAMSINGLNLAHEKYSNPLFYKRKQFAVQSLRRKKEGGTTRENIIVWDGLTAAEMHMQTVNYLSEYGIVDLYGALEDFVFHLYKIYLNAHPERLLQGEEFRPLKRLFRDKDTSEETKKAWEAGWDDRLLNWQRKKLYDGLHKVFLAYCNDAGLKTPSHYKDTNPEKWADNIEFIGLIRNHLVHGAVKVNKALGEFSNNKPWIPDMFTEGDDLTLDLSHLEAVELFTAQLCDALNFSLMERA